MSEFFIRSRVYIEDTDAGGIVYYVNYLKFMERARTELLRTLGSQFGDLRQNRLQYVVHSLDARYIKPALMDDELVITASVQKLGRAYIEFHQQVKRDDEVICDACIKVACVDTEQLKPVAIPESLANQFKAFKLNAEAK
ncbi:tol-pal system-associated acyl-CoA thioesterase [Ketobacter sp. MCCC 1A13808]|uniref:tol-pal system-associated acyl-CoA thioesterase n=1 Tax=Ketobacter sp. MCCC 1A13808 TaxID=2602738 RepID=UPI000F2B78C1|nr:tol-pal system-associated acyl-CoA thioesterase [Ketobacter sp. MCCC 1A13808]MVF10750.1 tol-pal system-associated acyl-CoA thioesterase [Ketobacter sp. MCCC 1A13808]RLP56164.1 MAG: tol-pal system-associated acyl-CoA thioesterase [Ketobacter sp.]